MADRKAQMIAAGFAVLGATGAHRLLRPFTRGQGAILMFHRVRPWTGGAFAPNRLLEITPEFLDAVLGLVARLGFDLVSMDEAVARIGAPGGRPFVALTFDDGYRDTRDCALPVLERHKAPFTLYVTTGFAERRARLWWVELEEAVARLDQVRLDQVRLDTAQLDLPARTTAEKYAAYKALYWRLRSGPEAALLAATGALCAQAGIDPTALVARDCLDWEGVATLAAHPLCTIGVHTLTHPMLAKHPDAMVRAELADSRAAIEARLQRPARHLAYPVGDPTSAGPREFALAAELGFASAVTTRPGMIFPDHSTHLTALPRLSINGEWQRLDAVEVLLSGAPFALWNRGRRVLAA
jgi:peptidoglycan/xylan/chitin deacetylase (PgdA/CDA1 family)